MFYATVLLQLTLTGIPEDVPEFGWFQDTVPYDSQFTCQETLPEKYREVYATMKDDNALDKMNIVEMRCMTVEDYVYRNEEFGHNFTAWGVRG
jgi:hypothetical protein